MIFLLCRNRVSDFEQWKSVFDSHAKAHGNVGLRLMNLWRSIEDPNNVFFLFEVANLDRAIGFINDSEAVKAGEASGLIEGEFHFIEDTNGYG